MDATLLTFWLPMIGGGFIIGLLVGMTGVGAGALTTPLLISGFGVPPAVAVGTDLLFASITKASAAWRHHRLGNVNWPILGYLALGSVAAACATLAWLHYTAPDMESLATLIRQVLAAALVLSALAIPIVPLIIQRKNTPSDQSTPPRPTPTILFGLLLGTLVTLTSVGAGAIGVAVLSLLYPQLLARRIVGTDIVHAIPLAFVSGLGHLSMGNVQVDILLALLAGSVPGIILGSRAIGLFPDWLLRIVLAAVLILAAYILASESGLIPYLGLPEIKLF